MIGDTEAKTGSVELGMCLPSMHEAGSDLCAPLSPAQNELGVVAHTSKTRTWEVTAGGVRSSRSFELRREVRLAWDTGNLALVCRSDVCSDSFQRPYFPESCDCR